MLSKSNLPDKLLTSEQALQIIKSSLEMFVIKGKWESQTFDIDMAVTDVEVLLHQLIINPVTYERNEFIYQIWLASIRQVVTNWQTSDLIKMSQMRNITKCFLQSYCKAMKL